MTEDLAELASAPPPQAILPAFEDDGVVARMRPKLRTWLLAVALISALTPFVGVVIAIATGAIELDGIAWFVVIGAGLTMPVALVLLAKPIVKSLGGGDYLIADRRRRTVELPRHRQTLSFDAVRALVTTTVTVTRRASQAFENSRSRLVDHPARAWLLETDAGETLGVLTLEDWRGGEQAEATAWLDALAEEFGWTQRDVDPAS